MLMSELEKAENTLRFLVSQPVTDDSVDRAWEAMLQVADIIKDARFLYESENDPFYLTRKVK